MCNKTWGKLFLLCFALLCFAFVIWQQEIGICNKWISGQFKLLIAVNFIISIIVQRDATQSSLFIILQVQSTFFRCQPSPIIRSTQNCNCSLQYWSYFLCSYPPTWPYWPWRAAAQKIWPVSEAVVTVLCTPDDECGWHPKHVEWTCRIINRLFCVAFRWKIINIDQRCAEP